MKFQHAIIVLLGAIAVAKVVDPSITLELSRCSDAKAADPALLAVLAVVSSSAREFGLRSELRQTQFQQARSLDSRTIFRPSDILTGVVSRRTRKDRRSVCVQPIFVLSPWVELRHDRSKILRQDDWRELGIESKRHQDLLIAPTIIDSHTRARELMHVLEWARQTASWADYVFSIDTGVRIKWSRMIELFPPPVPQKPVGHALWQLGSNIPSIDALFFKDPRVGQWRQCADVGVSAFSRDLVHQITRALFASQILYAVRHPFQMHKARCKSGASQCIK